MVTGLLGAKVRILWSVHNSDVSTIRTLIKDANEQVYHPTVIEPKERQQYMYEAAVRFPVAADNQLNFRYLHQPSENGLKEQLLIATDDSLNAAYQTLGNNVFENVPQYQRCSKEFIIQFADAGNETGFTKIGTKPLADGRTAHLYKNTSCDSVYKDHGLDMQAQQAIVEAIQSY
jgi:hypothetical protein